MSEDYIELRTAVWIDDVKYGMVRDIERDADKWTIEAHAEELGAVLTATIKHVLIGEDN